MKVVVRNYYLILEFVLLFFGIPLLLLFTHAMLYPALILGPIILAMIFYFRRKQITFKQLFSWNVSSGFLKKQLVLILLSSLLLLVGVYIFTPENLFNLPENNFGIWLVVFITYPIFSASLQEVIYRVFLLNRYRNLFSTSGSLIAASGFAFSFAHILYGQILSLILTLIQGLYLAYLYRKTYSFLLVAMVHSFYGNLVFTIGLGQYFWLGMEKYL